MKHLVAVCQDAPTDVLVGLDIGILDYLLTLEKLERAVVSATTRPQSKAKEREETQNKDLSERDKAKPKPLQTASKPKDITLSEKELGQEQSSKAKDSAPSDEELGREQSPDDGKEPEAIPSMLDTDSDGTDGSWPIPSLAADDRDKQTLITQQAKDESLAAIREWAQNNERGYNYQDGILVHTLESESGELCKRMPWLSHSVGGRRSYGSATPPSLVVTSPHLLHIETLKLMLTC